MNRGVLYTFLLTFTCCMYSTEYLKKVQSYLTQTPFNLEKNYKDFEQFMIQKTRYPWKLIDIPLSNNYYKHVVNHRFCVSCTTKSHSGVLRVVIGSTLLVFAVYHIKTLFKKARKKSKTGIVARIGLITLLSVVGWRMLTARNSMFSGKSII